MVEVHGRRQVLRAAAVTGVAAAVGGTAALAGPVAAAAGEDTAAAGGRKRRIGVLVYDRMTLLDAIGPAEVLSRLPGHSVSLIGRRRGDVRGDTRHGAVVADYRIDEVDHLDILLVPGGSGRGATAVVEHEPTMRWIRHIDARSTWTTSVCTGSLILAYAGLLQGHRATTYWSAKDELNAKGAVYVPERFVRSGKYVTAAGVSAGIDMGLYLSALLADDTTAKAVQLALEYDPQPPFDTGSPDKAGPELQQLAMRLLLQSQH
ncbi:DJ-1/PfpI family protein [Saccharothrix australiensis]|uniref:DJ-1/PfpI family protein n=1 Tax=Saccharothrix australiensis TaxID=2072 RepID=A0A495W288_9PSEU|nr:DJ-1/PfpI family protein [Saccharothrix australiensis]RKT55801.1 DJ-1/PfpI family protein [Saccharothrix australiensis]